MNANWAGSLDDRRSTSSYCTFVGCSLVTWRSKKQSVMARPGAETEYKAMALGVCKLLWANKVMTELGLPKNEPLLLYSDNKAAINIANNHI